MLAEHTAASIDLISTRNMLDLIGLCACSCQEVVLQQRKSTVQGESPDMERVRDFHLRLPEIIWTAEFLFYELAGYPINTAKGACFDLLAHLAQACEGYLIGNTSGSRKGC
jgi:hypothetical protein